MQKNISFKSNNSYLLRGVLHLPRGKGPFPAVIVQHGFTSDYNDVLIRQIAVKLERSGFVVLRFSFSAHPPSQGDYKNLLISQFVKDIKAGIKFLLKNKKVNQHRIGLVGHSMGAFSVLISSVILHKYLRSVISISSYYDLEALFRSYKRDNSIEEEGRDYWKIWGFKINKKHFDESSYLRKKYSIQDIHCPVLIIHGENDSVVQVKDARTIYKLLAEPKAIKIIKNGSHSFKKNQTQRKLISRSVVSWLNQYLAFKESPVVNAFI